LKKSIPPNSQIDDNNQSRSSKAPNEVSGASKKRLSFKYGGVKSNQLAITKTQAPSIQKNSDIGHLQQPNTSDSSTKDQNRTLPSSKISKKHLETSPSQESRSPNPKTTPPIVLDSFSIKVGQSTIISEANTKGNQPASENEKGLPFTEREIETIPKVAKEILDPQFDIRKMLRFSKEMAASLRPLPALAILVEPDLPTININLREEVEFIMRQPPKVNLSRVEPDHKHLYFTPQTRTEQNAASQDKHEGTNSQKPRSFRIKDRGTSSSRSRDRPLRLPPLEIEEKSKPYSDLAIKSNQTQPKSPHPASHTKPNRSLNLTDKEIMLNREGRKLEPFIMKYNDSEIFAKEKEKVRGKIVSELKSFSPLFNAFSFEFIEHLIVHGDFRFHNKGSELFDQTNPSTDKMAIVLFGVVHFTCPKGLVTLTHGGFLGEESVTSGQRVQMPKTLISEYSCLLWLRKEILQRLSEFCEANKKKTEYVLFVAQLQKQIKLRS
jgi:hypothetical protein